MRIAIGQTTKLWFEHIKRIGRNFSKFACHFEVEEFFRKNDNNQSLEHLFINNDEDGKSL